MTGNKKIAILLFHPQIHKSRVNSKLIEAVDGMEGVTTRYMYDLYPDFHIDLKVEQQMLLEHDVIVWHHPFYWYSSPSLLKEWIDIVLQHGFAYGREGKALAGKRVLTAISSGGSREVYREEDARNSSIRQLLLPFEQTANLCRLEYLPPFVVHGTHLLDDQGIARAAAEYKRVISALRDDAFSKTELGQLEYINDIKP
ncbi:MAG: NAD(P)H oxidoreductase [Bacteroidetes bacterium]|nr:NAD(P)H oxidoreductase [Bacteroidota bacterium]